MNLSARTFLTLLIFLGGLSTRLTALNPWEPVDLNFQASGEYSWWEFAVTALFHQEDDSTTSFTVEGFWRGENSWTIRTAFPKAGTWLWETTSPDHAMDNKRGRIEVVPANQEAIHANANLRGSIRMSGNGRFFEYADGTPFFVLASTLWAGNTARCGLGDKQDGPFFRHIADRKAKGFNTLLMQYFHGYGDYPESPGHRNEGGKAYLNIESKALNPEHFRYLDQRMQALWEEGFVAAIPTTWWGKTKNCVFTVEDALRMSRYCAVRYGAFNAIWGLSGEYQYAFQDCGWEAADFSRIGESVQQHNPHRRPLSIHPSGRTNWTPPHNALSSLPFHGEAWLDHHWLQTGQGRNRLFHMVTKLKENRALIPTMPIFLSEAFYERPADPESAYHTRWQVWTALLNGAAGFGYGAFGLWQFYDPNDPDGETGKYTGRELPWWEAQEFEGATQVHHAWKVLDNTDWWKLVPARESVRINGDPNPVPTAEDLSPLQVAHIDDSAWILYIPRGNEGNRIELPDLSKATWNEQWLNPRTGELSNTWTSSNQNYRLKLPSPASEDWVCILKLTTP